LVKGLFMANNRILIVEDEAVVALDIEDRLTRLGYQPAGLADNGDAALKLAQENRPDLVMMDIRLQGAEDGIAVARQIRRRFQIPVIFLTAYSEDDTLERAKLAEPSGYLLKPFNDRELKSAIEIAFCRHRAEADLKESLSLYQAALESTADGLLVVNLEGQIISWNRKFTDMWGIPAEIIASRDNLCVRAFVLDQLQDPQGFLTRAVELFNNPGLESCDLIHFKDGRIFERYSIPHFLDNRVVGRVLSFRDITLRKQAEESLKESERFIRNSFDSLSLHLAVLDGQGDIIYVNSAWDDFGRENGIAENSLRKNYLKVCDEANGPWSDEALQVAAGIRSVLAGKIDTFSLEYPCHSPEKERFFNLCVTRFRGDGPVRAVAAHEDITDRKQAEATRMQLEAQLLQAQKMEAIGTLARGIAHDFNNILWAIMGFSELTFNALPEGSKERWNINQVIKASERARDLVAQILAFSRKGDREKKPLQIALIVKESLKLLRATIPTTIAIKQDISGLEAKVLADPTQIHQLIMNLCTNAAQAMREKGDSLAVGLEEKYLDGADVLAYPDLAPGRYVMLTVTDNGPGIAPESIDKIFEPFFTTKGVGEGTGMGLAAVYGIVKSHGGGITVSSRLGEGAVFTIVLPKISSREPEEREGYLPLPQGSGHILVIDDEDMLVEMSKSMLASLGYEVTTAPGSLEALEIFRAQPDTFALVLTDQTMPHMDGLQLARELRHIRPDIPIILCTGFSEKVSPEAVAAARIDALLLKPVDFHNLGETIRKILVN
jgi:PAS domain S-box-containing protein